MSSTTNNADNAEHVFHVVHSNDLDALAQLTVHLMKMNTPKNPFEEVDVLIPNSGMKDWLDTRIAKYNDISMRINYQLPWNYLWILFNRLGMVEKTNPQERYRRENMVWNIFSLLPDLIENDATKDIFKSLYDYIHVDDGKKLKEANDKGNVDSEATDDSRLYQLSEVIANIFDGYIIYRSDWLHSATISSISYPKIYQEFQKLPSSSKTGATNLNHISSMWCGIGVSDFKELSDETRSFILNNVWQVVLWRKIVELNSFDFDPKDKESHLEGHLANMIERFVARIGSDTQLQSKLPKILYVFGISSLPPLFIKMLKSMSAYCKVFYMLLNPCKQYWGDIKSPQDDGSKRTIIEKISSGLERRSLDPDKKDFSVKDTHKAYDRAIQESFYDEEGTLISGNSLLVSWGKQGRDNLYQLVENQTTDTELFIDPWVENQSVLGAIQQDIYTLTERNPFSSGWENKNNRPIVWDNLKHNIQIHAAYTPMREVEAVYDYILHLFQSDETLKLKPNDLVVMTPNINFYAPYIEAVFGVPQADKEKNIPYVISDQSYERSSSFFNSFFSLMQLPTLRITGSLVLDLLSVETIAHRFDIEVSDLSTISSWIKKACIRGDYSEKELQKDSDNLVEIFSTWERALDRMLVGSVLPPDSGLYEENILPYTSIGTGQIDLLSKLKNFVDELNTLRKNLLTYAHGNSKGLTVTEWKNFVISNVMEKFYRIDSQHNIDDNEYDILKEFMSELINQFTNIGPGKLLTVDVFTSYIKNKASQRTLFHPFMSGKVNFCSFVPMRSIPFSHIIMLGMNSGDFPRNDVSYDFDLLRRNNGLYARPGDRSSRNDDRYMFLETVMAAKKSLYISYIGRSSIDNSVKNPSTVVLELQNYISKTFILEKNDKQRKQIIEEYEKTNDLITLNCKLFALYKENTKSLLTEVGNGLVFVDRLNAWDQKNFIIPDEQCNSESNESNQLIDNQNKKSSGKDNCQGKPYKSYLDNMCPLSSDPEKRSIEILSRFISSQLSANRSRFPLRNISWNEPVKHGGIEEQLINLVINSLSRSPVVKDTNGKLSELVYDTNTFIKSSDYKVLRDRLYKKSQEQKNNTNIEHKEQELWKILLQDLPSSIAKEVNEICRSQNANLVLQSLSFNNEFSTIVTDLGVKTAENIHENKVKLTLSINDLTEFMSNPFQKMLKERFGVKFEYKAPFENSSDDTDEDAEVLHSSILDQQFESKSDFDEKAKEVNFKKENLVDKASFIKLFEENNINSASNFVNNFFESLKYTGGIPSSSGFEDLYHGKVIDKLRTYLNDAELIQEKNDENYQRTDSQEINLSFDIPYELLPEAYRKLVKNGNKTFCVSIHDLVDGMYKNVETGAKIHIKFDHLSNVSNLCFKEYVTMLCLKASLSDDRLECQFTNKKSEKVYLVGKDINQKSAKALLLSLISSYLYGMQYPLPLSIFKDPCLMSNKSIFGKLTDILSNFKQAVAESVDNFQLISLTNDVPSVPNALLDPDENIKTHVLERIEPYTEIYWNDSKEDNLSDDVRDLLDQLWTPEGKFEKNFKITFRDKSFKELGFDLPVRRLLTAYYMLKLVPQIFIEEKPTKEKD